MKVVAPQDHTVPMEEYFREKKIKPAGWKINP